MNGSFFTLSSRIVQYTTNAIVRGKSTDGYSHFTHSTPPKAAHGTIPMQEKPKGRNGRTWTKTIKQMRLHPDPTGLVRSSAADLKRGEQTISPVTRSKRRNQPKNCLDSSKNRAWKHLPFRIAGTGISMREDYKATVYQGHAPNATLHCPGWPDHRTSCIQNNWPNTAMLLMNQSFTFAYIFPSTTHTQVQIAVSSSCL